MKNINMNIVYLFYKGFFFKGATKGCLEQWAGSFDNSPAAGSPAKLG